MFMSSENNVLRYIYGHILPILYVIIVQVVAWTRIQNSESYHVVIVRHRCKHKRFEYRLILT